MSVPSIEHSVIGSSHRASPLNKRESSRNGIPARAPQESPDKTRVEAPEELGSGLRHTRIA
ncbi:MAG: hypothetical protein JO249_11160 [Acidobacteria bacterium]|nr:hypothetical protein [Acidobacteriota bacterium]